MTSLIREALEAALEAATKKVLEPCNHEAGDTRKLRRLILRALAELGDA